MEPTHTILVTFELPVTLVGRRHVAELIPAFEDFVERVNNFLGDNDQRLEWSTIADRTGEPVAGLTGNPFNLSGLAVLDPDGGTLIDYLGPE